MNLPKVSIIVPIYNAECYLTQCLSSILNQAFRDFEAILVDDGSTDNSGKICDEYARNDNRFVVVHKQNEGVAIARITGFEHSRGDFITFIDADDYIDEKYVEHLYECIIKNNVDASFCQYFKVDKNGKHLSKRKNFGYFDKSGIEHIIIPGLGWDCKLGKESIAPVLWAKMMKRDFVKEILDAGKGLWYGEDQCGVLRLLYLANSIYHSEAPLYYYVFHDGQVTAKMDRSRWDAYIQYWNRMISEDIKGLYSPHIPYRIHKHLKKYLNSWLNKKVPYKTFKEEATYALNSSFLQKYLFQANLEGQTFKQKIKIFLLKKKCVFPYYFFKRMR